MPKIIDITDLNMPELDIYARPDQSVGSFAFYRIDRYDILYLNIERNGIMQL